MSILFYLQACLHARAIALAIFTPKPITGPELSIWLNPGVVPSPTPAVPLGCITALGRRPVYVNERICFGSDTSACMGNHESLEAGGALVEEELKWKWLR